METSRCSATSLLARHVKVQHSSFRKTHPGAAQSTVGQTPCKALQAAVEQTRRGAAQASVTAQTDVQGIFPGAAKAGVNRQVQG
jgi:hypothetical protein